MQNRLGEVLKSNEGYYFKVIEYNSSLDVVVKLIDTNIDYTKRGSYHNFKNGAIKNPFHRGMCGVGFIGVGDFKTKENGKFTKCYVTWSGMFKRCYNEKDIKKRKRYSECNVCDEWHNFQNFAKWFEENYYEVDGEKMCLDKDILVKGNKVYSPETCVFVPNRINVLFVNKKANRGDSPVGVTFRKETGRFLSNFSYDGKGMKFLGSFKNKEEAFDIYKKEKEKFIKNMADRYKGKIPQKLYDAMYKYEIEITD